jgi:hypothetical protein
MVSYVFRGLCVIATAGAFALTATPPAEARVTVGTAGGYCTVTALKPAPVVVEFGRKHSGPRASVSCTKNAYVRVDLYLYGDDLLFDDLVARRGLSRVVTPTLVTLGEADSLCDEDLEGADELYSKVRVAIIIPGAHSFPTSAWDKGPTVTYNC